MNLWASRSLRHRRLVTGYALALFLLQGSAGVAETEAAEDAVDFTTSSTEAELRATLASFQSAVTVARRLGRVDAEAEALYASAITYRALGRLQAAQNHAEWALELYEGLEDRQGLAAALDLLGTLHAAGGRMPEAGDAFDKALEHRRAIGDLEGQAQSLHNLASWSLDRGDAPAALENLSRALELHRKQKNRAGEASALNNLGLLWLRLGRHLRARDHLEHAVRLFDELGDDRGLAGASNNLGLLAYSDGRFADAARQFGVALRLWQSLGDIGAQAEVLGNLGLAKLESGHFEDARRLLEDAIELAKGHGLDRTLASHRGSLGRFELRRGHTKKAIHELTGALEMMGGHIRARAITLLDLAQAHRERGELEFALAAIEESVGLIEDLRDSLTDGPTLAHALAAERHYYDQHVDLLIELARPRQALLATENARARGLLQLLRLADTARPDPLSDLASIQSLLDEHTVVLAYYLGERSAWLFKISKDQLEVHPLGASDEIEALADTAYRALTRSRRRAYRGPAKLAAKALGERILSPFLAAAGPVPAKLDRLVIVPDGGLHRIPFSALMDAVEEPPGLNKVLRIPSLSVLAELRRNRRPPSPTPELAILADPIFEAVDPRLADQPPPPTQTNASFARLPWSGHEAERIAALFPQADPARVDLRLGLEANKEAFSGDRLARFDWLHLATHALIDDRNPERSGLALSSWSPQLEAGDGFLSLGDLLDLRLEAELVTLSACRSALGKSLRGEGLLGLSQGFFAAGARRLVLSLWDVDDRAAAELMEHFYRGLIAGDGPAAALAAAQGKMRRDPRWRAPFYWAGFVLIGDWR